MVIDDRFSVVPDNDFIERDDDNEEIRDETIQNNAAFDGDNDPPDKINSDNECADKGNFDNNDDADKRNTDELREELRRNIEKKKMSRMQKSQYSTEDGIHNCKNI